MPPLPQGVEAWAANSIKAYNKLTTLVKEGHWTRWFNFHSRAHMEQTYKRSLQWLMKQDGSRPIYTQKQWPDIPGSQAFPCKQVQAHFATSLGPSRYFTCSLAWLTAYAIMQKPTRIEYWGLALSDRKAGEAYTFERPCMFYWIQQARDRGIDVWYPPEVEAIPFEPGSAEAYTGLLYGFSTKSEPDWCLTHEEFGCCID